MPCLAETHNNNNNNHNNDDDNKENNEKTSTWLMEPKVMQVSAFLYYSIVRGFFFSFLAIFKKRALLINYVILRFLTKFNCKQHITLVKSNCKLD